MAIQPFDSRWRDGFRYAKAGVMLGDFCDPDDVQLNLYDDQPSNQRNDQLMQAVDAINQKGQGKIWFGGQRPKKDWFMWQANVSPAYTTRWECLPVVK